MDSKLCPGCDLILGIDQFNWKNRAKGRRQVRCRDCTKEQVRNHYANNRCYYLKKARIRNDIVLRDQQKQVLEYLSVHPCVDCGESDVVCLDFDHVRGEKKGDIGRMLGNHAWTTIVAEIAKCDVRCANCHRRQTAKRLGSYRFVALQVDDAHP
jgi:hypothetical protein